MNENKSVDGRSDRARCGAPIVRTGTAADIPAIFEIRTSVLENHLDLEHLAERGVSPESVAEALATGDAQLWVVEEEDGGRLTGFSMANGRSGAVSALFVLPGSEGHGHGRALLAATEEWLFGLGWETICLQTGDPPHNRAHAFYRAGGWVLVGPADHGDVRYEKSRRDRGGASRQA